MFGSSYTKLFGSVETKFNRIILFKCYCIVKLSFMYITAPSIQLVSDFFFNFLIIYMDDFETS